MGRKSGAPCLSAVLEGCCACPLARHHTRPHRRLRCADGGEKGAVEGCQLSFEDLAATAPGVLPRLFYCDRKRTLRVKEGIFFTDCQTAPRNDADAAPGGVARGK